jgi:drug/metabolite transporter (DMT)-like permease
MGRMPLRQAATLAIGVVAVGFAAIFIRLADAPSLTIALYRNALAAAVLLPLALTRHRDEIRKLSRRQWLIALGSGALLAIHFATWISSLALTTVAASVVLVTTGPIFTAAGQRVFLHEPVSRRTFEGILVGLAGTAIVAGGGFALSSSAAVGDLLALAGAVTAAGYFLAGRSLRRDVSLLTYVALVYATCAVLLFLMVLVSGAALTGFDGQTWVMFVLLALVPQLVGHTTFNYLLRDLDATFVAIAVMGEPVVSTVLALGFFGEVPPWTAVAGGLLILAGIYVAAAGEGRRGRRPHEVPVALE